MVSEFEVPKEGDPTLDKYQFHWLYANGLLGIIFTFCLLYTSLKSRRARSWLYGTGLSWKLLVIIWGFEPSLVDLDSATSWTAHILISFKNIELEVSTVQFWSDSPDVAIYMQSWGCDCTQPGSIITMVGVRNLTLFVYWEGWLRSFIADYGVPFLVVVWTALSFTVVASKVPSGVPRRLVAPLAWESASFHHWTVIKVKQLIAYWKPLDFIISFVW